MLRAQVDRAADAERHLSADKGVQALQRAQAQPPQRRQPHRAGLRAAAAAVLPGCRVVASKRVQGAAGQLDAILRLLARFVRAHVGLPQLSACQVGRKGEGAVGWAREVGSAQRLGRPAACVGGWLDRAKAPCARSRAAAARYLSGARSPNHARAPRPCRLPPPSAGGPKAHRSCRLPAWYPASGPVGPHHPRAWPGAGGASQASVIPGPHSGGARAHAGGGEHDSAGSRRSAGCNGHAGAPLQARKCPTTPPRLPAPRRRARCAPPWRRPWRRGAWQGSAEVWARA